MILLPVTTPIECYEASDDAILATTQTPPDWVQKLRLAIPAKAVGVFRISWSIEWALDNTTKPGFIQSELDDSTILGAYNLLAGDKCVPGDPDSEFWCAVSGFEYVTLTAVGHTVDLDIGVTAGKTIFVRRAKLDAIKVA